VPAPENCNTRKGKTGQKPNGTPNYWGESYPEGDPYTHWKGKMTQKGLNQVKNGREETLGETIVKSLRRNDIE